MFGGGARDDAAAGSSREEKLVTWCLGPWIGNMRVKVRRRMARGN